MKIPYQTLAKYLCIDKSKRKVVGCSVGPARGAAREKAAREAAAREAKAAARETKAAAREAAPSARGMSDE